MAKIAIIGTGYVGLASAVGFAHLGHEVVGIDINKAKVAKLSSGQSPIFEKDIEVFLNFGSQKDQTEKILRNFFKRSYE